MDLNIRKLFRDYGKNFLIFLSLIIVFLNINILSSKINRINNPSYSIPIESFIKLRQIVEYKECKDCEGLETFYLEGSGVAIDKDTILTAGHVCEGMKQVGKERLEGFSIKTYIIDYDGTKRTSFSIAKIDEKNDLCLIKSKGNRNYARISASRPDIGDLTYSVSSPHGVFSANNVLLYSGYYTGIDGDEQSVFTILAKPGSSGGPVFNQNGEIISIISSTHINIENIAFGTELSFIHEFLR